MPIKLLMRKVMVKNAKTRSDQIAVKYNYAKGLKSN